MDTAEFLARVIPTGNFFHIAYNTTPGAKHGFRSRMFAAGEFASAAGFVRWCDGRGWDAYHAQASFLVAAADGSDTRGRPKFRGERSQANAQRLRGFWIDMDVKRDGDGKLASQCYPSQGAALAWLKSFLAATGLPRPNLAVNSGYGLHIYWCLEDELAAADWQPHADALKAAMLANGFVGDSGITADAARLMRPAGTHNHKVTAAPVPVDTIAALSAGDIPNALFLAPLAPFLGAAPRRAAGSGAGPSATAHALAGGGSNVRSILSARGGAAAAPNLNAAAQANLPQVQHRDRSLALIATECAQVGKSLADHGQNDTYPLWYLGHLTLAHFCADGQQFVHPLSDAHRDYTAAAIDSAVAQVAAEVTRKGSGPAPCSHFDRARPGVCGACPHNGKIRGPYDLGVADGDLPHGYRRHQGRIEAQVWDKVEKAMIWAELLRGDVFAPVLDDGDYGRALGFTYQRGIRRRSIRIVEHELPADAGAVFRMAAQQGLTLTQGCELRFRGFVVAWIQKLQDARAERTENIHPFGWATDEHGAHSGLAIGGTLYRPDGREEPAPGGDRTVLAMYQPRGSFAEWRRAFDLVATGRPDLQVLIAGSFGAPLMRLTGHSGLAIAAWSRESGVGKSSALRIGQAVWSSQKALNSLDDTPNSVNRKVAQTRVMPANWDEMRIGQEDVKRFVNLMFSFSQGKEKSRLNADSSLRAVEEWDTLLITASNRPLMDSVTAETEGTEAGALRVFEFGITRPPCAQVPGAAQTIGLVATNYGSAGRQYAKFLAQNYDRVRKIVDHYIAMLSGLCRAEQSERLYVSGMACVMAGAAIATKLNLAAFELPEMQAFLTRTFAELRIARRGNMVVSSNGYDLEQILGMYMSEMMGRKIITDRFHRPGPKHVEIKWHPQDRQHVEIHVSQHDRILRISRSAFIEWTRRRQLSGFDVIENMRKEWGASVVRRVIAGGVGYSGGQLWCLDIPLTRPELENYLYADAGAQAQAQAQAAQPVRKAAPLKGNQAQP